MSSIARIDRAIDVRRLACVWGVRACSSLVTIRRESLSLCALWCVQTPPIVRAPTRGAGAGGARLKGGDRSRAVDMAEILAGIAIVGLGACADAAQRGGYARWGRWGVM